MMQDVDIFIFGQDVPKIYPKSPEYKLVSIEKIDKPCDIEKICLSDECYDDKLFKMEHAYSEGARIHSLWLNYPLKKYVGTAHYRRYFEFFDNIPNLDEIFEDHDAIYQSFDIGWPTIRSNYEACHNIKDLDACISIINYYFPEYRASAEYVMNNNFFVPCNIFIMKRELFCEWCRFVFGVLDRFNQNRGFTTDLDVCNWVVNHMEDYVDGKGGEPNSNTSYQSRIHSFLMERISTIFFKEKVKNPYFCDIVLTEIHREFERTYFKQYNDK